MKFSRSIIFICLSSFIRVFGAVVSFALIFFIPDMFGVNEAIAGLIVTLCSSGAFIGAFFFPPLTRKLKPINHHLLATLVAAFGFSLAAIFYDRLIFVFVGSFLGYVGLANAGLVNTKLIAILSSEQMRRSSYTLNFIAINTGALFAPLIALSLYSNGVSYMRYIFLVNGMLALASTVMIRFALRKDDSISMVSNKNNSKNLVKMVNTNWIFIYSLIILYFGFMQLMYLVPKSIESNINITYSAIMMSVNTIICVLFVPILARVTRNCTIKKSIQLGIISIIVGLIFFSAVNSMLFTFIAVFIFTCGDILVFTNIDAYISFKYEQAEFDSMLVINKLIVQLMRVVSPLIIGSLLMILPYSFVFWICALITLISLVMTKSKQY